MDEELRQNAEHRMRGAMEALVEDLGTIRTGRASPALVERLTVDYYGSPTPLNQLASISVPEPRVLFVRPWDRSSLASVERAIQASDLGLTPSNDGQTIRLLIPQLTEERRHELIRVAHKRVEEARVAVRNIRRDLLHELQELEKNKVISEDQYYAARTEAQQLTDEYIQRVDEVGRAKEAEIMEV
jgi:ribosome recycling factor